MPDVKKHSQAHLYPSEVVTLGLLFALEGVGNRAFYSQLKRDYLHLFPKLPERTWLFCLFNSHRKWIDRFMAEPSLIGMVDSYGVELIHLRWEGRSPKWIGPKGLFNPVGHGKGWIVGGKLCLLLNHLGLTVDWDCDTANAHDGSAFQHLVEGVRDQMVIPGGLRFADDAFAKADWHPPM